MSKIKEIFKSIFKSKPRKVSRVSSQGLDEDYPMKKLDDARSKGERLKM